MYDQLHPMKKLYECHGHMLMDGNDYAAARKRHLESPDITLIRSQLQSLKDAGISYFRDGGDDLGVSLAARSMAADYGIDFVTPGFAIHKKGYYGSIVGKSYCCLSDFRKRLTELKNEGGDFVKIMLSGIITFKKYGELSCESLPDEEIKELIHIAHGEGFSVMVHVNGKKAILAAAKAGVDSIEHGYFGDDECLFSMAENNCIWVPTLAAIEGFIGRDGFDRQVTRETLLRQMKLLKRAEELGVFLASGSDSGAVGVPHGEGTKAEYRLLKKAGISDETIEKGNRKIAERFTGR